MTEDYPAILDVSPEYLREFPSFPDGDAPVFVNRAIYDFEDEYDIAVVLKPRWDPDTASPYWIIEILDSVQGIGAVSTVEGRFESVEQAVTHVETSIERLSRHV
jgi:hypothetical protein